MVSSQNIPTPTVSGNTSVCSGTPQSYVATASQQGSSLSWTVSGVTITGSSTSATLTVTAGAAGSAWVKVVETNGQCTGTSAQYNIAINALPTSVITSATGLNATGVCQGTTHSYATASNAGSSYQWTAGGATIVGGANTNANVQIQYTQSGIISISVREINASQCTTTVAQNVTVNALPNPTISGAQSVCTGVTQSYSSGFNSNNSYQWVVGGGGSAVGSTTSNSISVNWTTSGYVQLTETVNATSCAVTTQQYAVAVNPLPTPVIGGVSVSCSGVQQSFSASVSNGGTPSYVWSVTPGGTQFSGQGTSTIVVTVPTTNMTIKVVTQYQSSGCKDSSSKSVAVNLTPAPQIAGNTSPCVGTSQTYSVVTPNGTSSYAWNKSGVGTFTGGTTGTSVTLSYASAGTTTITATETTNASCTGTSQGLVVTSYSIPAPSVTGDASVCAGSTKVYSVASPGSSSSYAWTVSGVTVSGVTNASSVTVLCNTAGAAWVKVTEMNGPCTGTSAQYNITINALPMPVITSSTGGLNATGVCQGTTHSYATASNAGSSYQWTISGGTLLTASTNASVQVQWTGFGSGTIKAQETTAAGCAVETQNATVPINPAPNPSISGNQSACTNQQQNYSTTFTSGRTYAWSIVQNGQSLGFSQGANAAAITVNYTNSGAATVAVTETVNGCSKSTVLTTVVYASPSPVVSGSSAVCTGATHTYSTPQNSGSSYAWTVLPAGTQFGGQGTSSITVLWNAATTNASVQVNEMSGNNCGAQSQSKTVTVTQTPAPSISGVQSACIGTQQSYSTTAVSGNSYAWTVTNATVVSGASASTLVVQLSQAGAVTLSLTESRNSCSTTATMQIQANALPTPAITGAASVCTGAITQYTTQSNQGSSYAWTLSSNGTITQGSTGNAITVQWNTSNASGFVRVTETNVSGCSAQSAQYNVVAGQTPVPVLTSSTNGLNNVCSGSTHVYATQSNSGSSYAWQLTAPSGTTSSISANSITIVWGGTGSAQLQVTESTTQNCAATAQANINVHATPVPSVSGQTSVCQGSQTSYTTSPVAGNTYAWTVSGGSISGTTNTSSIQVSFATAGAATVSVIETTPLGCSKQSNTLSITVNALPVASIASSTNGLVNVCAQSTHAYNVASVSGVSYNWSANGGTVQTGQGTNAVSVLWGSGSQGTVFVTETITSTGCSATMQNTATINALPVPQLSGSNFVCEGSTQSYSTNFSAGRTYTWTVQPAGTSFTTGATAATINVTWGSAGSGMVAVSETNTATGCMATASIQNITINPKPAPSIAGSAVVCQNSIVNYTTTFTNGNAYQWTVSGAVLEVGQGTNSVQVRMTTAGSASITVMERNTLTNCSNQTNRTIAVNASPNPMISGPSVACGNQEFTYTAGTAGNTVVWSVTGGAITSGQGTPIVKVLWGAIGVGTLRVSETNTAGCTVQTDYYNVAFSTVPNATITGSTQSCRGTTQNYTVPQLTGVNYQWTVTGGSLQSGQGTNSIAVNWGAGSTGTITLLATVVQTGCTATGQLSVALQVAPTVSITASANTSLCEGDRLFIAATSGFTSYKWSSGEITDVITVTTGGQYSVVATNASGCSATSNVITVTLIPAAAPVITASGPLAFCTGGFVTLDAGAGFVSYRWTNGATTRTINVQQSGSYAVTGTNAGGCSRISAPVTVSVTDSPQPVLTASGPLSFCEGASVTLDAGAGFQSYQWSTGATTRTITVTAAGTYTVTVMVSGGCTGTSQPVQVVVHTNPTAVVTASGATSFCAGESVTLAAPSGMSFYEWSNNAVTQSILVTLSGDYRCTITNTDGCKATSQAITVVVHPLPAKPVVTFIGATLGTSAAGTLQWRLNGTDIAGATAATYTPAQDGKYSVHVRNANGCVNVSDELDVKLGKVTADAATYKMSLRPNPASTDLVVEFMNERGEEHVVYDILNDIGRLMMSIDGGIQGGLIQQQIDVHELPAGSYILRIRFDKTVIEKTFVVVK